jgi:predicted adenylyl cyclase CyaB
MPSNVEIKCRVTDADRFRQAAVALSDRQEVICQDDTFFASPRGRLKLRSFADGTGELIYYERADEAGPKQSRYWISRTQDPESLRDTLGNALGVIGVVRKTRHLFMVGQTRIHLDDVEGLGVFAELEVVMQAGQTVEDGMSIATDLMRKLGIDEADLVEGAYIDLIGPA